MKHEDSAILRWIADEANAQIISGKTTRHTMSNNGEMDKIVDNVILRSPELVPEYANNITRRAARAVNARQTHDENIQRKVSKRFWSQIRIFRELLALAEVANRIQQEAIHDWKGDDFDRKFVPPFQHDGLIGGAGAKCLLLNSLEARVIVVGQEILELLALGFSEGASSRARTLHEILVITSALSGSGAQTDNYNLTNRYYLSSLIERRRMGFEDTEDRRLSRKIRKRWGPEFFDQYGWARPILNLGRNERPTFAQIERYVELNEYRFLYTEFNDSIHAGSLNTIRRTDFRLRYPNFTRSENDVTSIARILHVTSAYVNISMNITIRAVAHETSTWDNVVLIGLIDRVAHPLRELSRFNS